MSRSACEQFAAIMREARMQYGSGELANAVKTIARAERIAGEKILRKDIALRARAIGLIWRLYDNDLHGYETLMNLDQTLRELVDGRYDDRDKDYLQPLGNCVEAVLLSNQGCNLEAFDLLSNTIADAHERADFRWLPLRILLHI